MLLGVGVMHAKFHTVNRSEKLQNLIDEYAYSIVCMAPSKMSKDEQPSSQDRKRTTRTFSSIKSLVRSASQLRDFKNYLDKDIGFIVVDTASKDAQDLVQEYKVGTVPICIPFDQGAQSGAMVYNPQSSKQLVDSLENMGGKDLQKILNQRREDVRLEKQERIAAYYAYANTYPYWGWGGYYGYGFYPYWQRPYRIGWYV